MMRSTAWLRSDTFIAWPSSSINGGGRNGTPRLLLDSQACSCFIATGIFPLPAEKFSLITSDCLAHRIELFTQILAILYAVDPNLLLLTLILQSTQSQLSGEH